jgi:rare lipoprotein A
VIGRRLGGRVLLVAAVALGLAVEGCFDRGALRDASPGRRATAVASWYGEPFHGRLTASGERYDMHGFTAAHRSLPFGTRLKVTSAATGRSSVVIVNDRGPFIRGRDLDLSYGAAKEIGLTGEGVGRVAVEVMDRDLRYQKRVVDTTVAQTASSPDAFAIQFGAFLDPENASRLKQALELETTDVSITQAVVDGALYHRVRLGPFASRDEAIGRAQAFADEGYDTLIVSR